MGSWLVGHALHKPILSFSRGQQRRLVLLLPGGCFRFHLVSTLLRTWFVRSVQIYGFHFVVPRTTYYAGTESGNVVSHRSIG